MISCHPEAADASAPWKYAAAFKNVETTDFLKIAEIISKNVWSGIIWENGVRKQRNFVSSDWCVLDFDSGGMTLGEACEEFADYAHIIGTTKSHQRAKEDQQPCDRFRVLIPWEKRIDGLDLYLHNMKELIECLPVDPACKDGARYFFPCQEIISVEPNGIVINVDLPLPRREPEVKRTRREEAGHGIPHYAVQVLKSILPPGERNQKLWRAAKDLLRAGLKADEIEMMIHDSPTQKTNPLPVAEVHALVRSAAKSIEEETRG